jgi:hypothetical protein
MTWVRAAALLLRKIAGKSLASPPVLLNSDPLYLGNLNLGG